ncbi:hypothetical protein J31TS4_27250 [Paenibacillus sp. J31TS4]|uniref:general stress protein n=1 Tax=Paenibacillus sp. J31TS4 TaxID=2807195 RepID=UPI001B13A907|nr:general stress protein [Paenibacillus sp. J31TS4]GIP39445.1 hypothetical protein J31TS4_27250 [Paenibacillus sp. J31TS4]
MENKKIVGVFETEQEASRAIEALKNEGFRTEDISVVAKDKNEVESLSEETKVKGLDGAATGMTAGGVLGGVTGLMAGLGALAVPGVGPLLAAGPIAATLTGVTIGAGAGGLVGALIGLGLPEAEAKEYQGYVDKGHFLVLVDADVVRGKRVHEIFETNRSLIAERHGSTDRASAGQADVKEGPVDHAKPGINEMNGTETVYGTGAYPKDGTAPDAGWADRPPGTGMDGYREEEARREHGRIRASHDPSEGTGRG